MFTVTITEKGGEQRTLEFDKAEVTIGRVQGNDILLPKGNVSKRHARIVLKDGKFIIVDLKSTNGTYVNGRKITSPVVIKEGDKVYIGDFVMAIEEGGGAQAAAGPAPAAAPPPAPPHGPREAPAAALGGAAAAGAAEPERMPPPASPPASLQQRRPPPSPPKRAAAPGGAAAPAGADEPEDLGSASLEGGAGRAGNLPPSERAMAPRSTRASAIQAPPPPGPAPAPVVPEQSSGRRAHGHAQSRDPLAARVAAVGAREPIPPVSPISPISPISKSSGAQDAVPARELPHPPAHEHAPARLATAAAAGLAARPAPAAIITTTAAQPPGIAGGHGLVVEGIPASAAQPDPRWARLLELQREIHDRLASQLEIDQIPIQKLNDEALWQRAESAVCDVIEQLDADGAITGSVNQDSLIKDALNELLGLGPLGDLLADGQVTRVFVNRPDHVLVEREGSLLPYEKVFSSDAALRRVIARLVVPSGGRIDEDNPLIDVRIRDGARLTAAVPPLATRGTCLTLSKRRLPAPTLQDLVVSGALSPQMATFLTTCVMARRNIVVCGGPGSGKSTLLSVLANQVPASERIVSVEDVAEIALQRDNWIAFETRSEDTAGKRPVSLTEALRAAIRMRPDRLVVGDIVGSEAFDLLSALATGYEGSLASISADSSRAALTVLESLCRLVAGTAAPEALRELVSRAVHIVVHCVRYGDGVRRVTSIAEVLGTEGNEYTIRGLFRFQLDGASSDGRLQGSFAGANVTPRFYEILESRGLAVDPGIFR
ncbi:MAG: ATPase, T2SS/T4P/T4SS family [Pseudomonadota bacterium]